MDVKERNHHFLRGSIDREDLWPKMTEWQNQRHTFFFEFAPRELPKQPGLMLVRGPRQFGKSTWLEMMLKDTLEDFGKGTGFFINGDDWEDEEALLNELLDLEALFPKKAKIKRIFIDEVSSIKHWEKAFKRAFDRGHLRDVLVVTTGSSARDLRRGSEKLPGRKGKLPTNEYLFLPVSYHQFYKSCYEELTHQNVPPWVVYLLSGGSPLAINEILFDSKIPEFLFTLTKDWIQGDIVGAGRDRISLRNIFQAIYRFAPSPIGFAKLAREAGMANNTVASGYIEQLSDLLVVIPSFQKDWEKNISLTRKPSKFHFINTLAASIYHPRVIKYVDDIRSFKPAEVAILLEWLVAQELYRRMAYRRQIDLKLNFDPEDLGFWKSSEHEIDFIDCENNMYEVKLGKTSPTEFLWFKKTFPNKKLTVISASAYEHDWIIGKTIHQFLMEGPTFDFIQEWTDPVERYGEIRHKVDLTLDK